VSERHRQRQRETERDEKVSHFISQKEVCSRQKESLDLVGMTKVTSKVQRSLTILRRERKCKGESSTVDSNTHFILNVHSHTRLDQERDERHTLLLKRGASMMKEIVSVLPTSMSVADKEPNDLISQMNRSPGLQEKGNKVFPMA
jgi:hypothetical protein